MCPLSAVLRARLMSHVWLVARSEQLRQLPVQLASLASLEDGVTHGLQSLLESPSWLVALVAPISSVEQVFCLPRRSRSCSPLPRGSVLLSQRGPTGLSVMSCPAAPPDRSFSTHCRSGIRARPVPGRLQGRLVSPRAYGIIDGQWRREEGCIGPKQKDADLWIQICVLLVKWT